MLTPTHFKRLTGILAAAIILAVASESVAQPTIYGVQSRLSTPTPPRFQLFDHINDDSTIANPDSPLFIIAGGIYGATLRDGIFYGIELENGTGKDFLVTIPTEGQALGARVSEVEIGFSDVEGLANVNGQLMAISLNFGGHVTRLITIDHETGIGTLVGQGSFDVVLVGLAYDPLANTLYGTGVPFGGNNNASLYIVDPETGGTTLVGNLGTTLQSLAWKADLGLIGSFDHLYQINTNTGLATQIGSTDYTDGLGTGPELFNGIYALAANPNVEIAPVRITSITTNAQNEVVITWESESGFSYRVELNDTLQANAWATVSDPLPGQPESMSYTLEAGAPLDPTFYRVAKSL